MRHPALASSGLLALPALLGAADARANPADVFGLGARSTALGGAVAASVTDFSASYYNPAGLARAPGTEISLGYVSASHRLEMNGEDSRVDPVRGLVGGVVAPGRLFGVPFAFGMATHLGDDRVSRARTFRTEEPRWVLYDNRSQLLYLSAALAIRPFEALALGGGVTFLAATRGSFGITGRAVIPVSDPSASPYDSQLRHEVDADLSAVRYPMAGVAVMPNPQLSFAAVWRGQAKIDLAIAADLRGDIDAQILKAPAHYALDSRTVSQFIPQQVVIGSAYRPRPEITIGFDLVWVEWSAYESPISATESELDVDAPAGLVELPPNPKPSAPADPGFEDRLVPRAGVEWRLAPLSTLHLPVRLGYVYERSPVPPQTGATNFVDTDRHVISLGTGVLVERPGALVERNLRFDLHAQWSMLPTRTTLKDNPADFVGDYRAGGGIVAIGATFTAGFR
jgi:long-chain fatty acid transport protein